jgi:hypothetical protein
MFNDLPEHLKLRVHELLQANDFPSAKEVHDNWMLEQHHPAILDEPVFA